MFSLLARFGSWLLGGLVAIAPTLVGQVLVGLGVAVVSYTGLSATIDFLKDGAVSAFLDLPPEVVGMLALMRVGQCVSMVFSAITVRLAIQGLGSDAVKRFVKQ
jgi:NO-binding membrane sensor protein with MHYT domain